MTKLPKPQRAQPAHAGALLTQMRRVLTKLLAQEWPPEFQGGLVILVRQLSEIERSGADGAELHRALTPIVEALRRARAQAQRIDPARVMTFESALGALTELMEGSDATQGPRNLAA